MIWFTSFSLVIILLSLNDHVESRQAIYGTESLTPWANRKTANAFMTCLIQDIARSPIFPEQEKEDLEAVVETILVAVSNRKTIQSGNVQNQLKAINTAFAASMAELLIAEDVGNDQAVTQKLEVLSQSINICYQTTLGVVNTKFTTEIRNLVRVLAAEVTQEFNEITDIKDTSQETYDASTAVSTSQATSASSTTSSAASVAAQSSYGLEVSSGTGISTGFGGSVSVASSAFVQVAIENLSRSLMSSQVFCQNLGSLRGQTAVNYLNDIVGTGLANLGVDSRTISVIRNDIRISVSSLGATVSISSYVSSMSSTVVRGLASSGFLTADNASRVVSSLGSYFIQVSSNVASRYGIQISQNQVSAASTAVSTSQATSASSTTSSAASVAAQSSYGLGVSSEAGISTGFGGSLLKGVSGYIQGSEVSSGSFSVRRLKDSPVGLSSAVAASRIQNLSSAIQRLFQSGSFDFRSFGEITGSIVGRVRQSGLSGDDAIFESLLEVLAALIQVLLSAHGGLANLASTSSITSSLVEVFGYVV